MVYLLKNIWFYTNLNELETQLYVKLKRDEIFHEMITSSLVQFDWSMLIHKLIILLVSYIDRYFISLVFLYNIRFKYTERQIKVWNFIKYYTTASKFIIDRVLNDWWVNQWSPTHFFFISHKIRRLDPSTSQHFFFFFFQSLKNTWIIYLSLEGCLGGKNP